ncbi:MAG: Ku protein [Acidimicrobiia bacterium]|nr:Ku protein [Acidimicrobiia bacterium]
MARAIWSGSISFGLVNVPVKLYSAVHQQDIHFSQFDKNGNHIRYKRVSEKTGREVDYGDIVKGYEVKKGQWVMVDPDELAEYRPDATKTIDISDFVALEEIDPIYYESTYYLAPDGKAAGKPYNLLLEAMEKQQKVAIGKVVLRTKQYLAAIRPLEGALALSTMLFADEVVPASEVTNGSASGKDASVSKREVDMATQIIDSLTSKWDPSQYHDTYREEVLELLKKKAEGEEIVVETPDEEEGGEVLDLMAALEASLAEAKKGGRSSAKKTSGAKAKKSA